MAVLARLLLHSGQRLDLPDVLSIDSYSAADFKYLIQSFIGPKNYVLKGFKIKNPNNAIGNTSISMEVANSVVYSPLNDSGSFYYALPDEADITPELRANAVNYLYLTLSVEETGSDLRGFWNPSAEGGVGADFSQQVNTQTVLVVNLNGSTSTFPEGSIPIAKVSLNDIYIQSIEDCRDLMFRLGTGGLSPNASYTYQFKSLPSADYARNEPPTKIVNSTGTDPFQGGDKNIYTLKEWMDVVMTKLLELSGTSFWYEPAAVTNINNLLKDTSFSILTSKGKYSYSNNTLAWNSDLWYNYFDDPRTITFRATSTTSLTNHKLAYYALIRGKEVNPYAIKLNWTNGSVYVNADIGAFSNLTKGDWIKSTSDINQRYVKVVNFRSDVNGGGIDIIPAFAKCVVLESPYMGETLENYGVYSKGIYETTDLKTESWDYEVLNEYKEDLLPIAFRQDTILPIQTITSYSLTGNITFTDGIKALVHCTSHGLNDNDPVNIATGFYQGTYNIQKIDANNFYIFTDVLDLVTVTLNYATVITKSNVSYGITYTNEDNFFKTNQSIVVAGTSSYDGTYQINPKTSSSFNIAPIGYYAQEIVGSVTLKQIKVRVDKNFINAYDGEDVYFDLNQDDKYVTTDKRQSISGLKTFKDNITLEKQLEVIHDVHIRDHVTIQGSTTHNADTSNSFVMPLTRPTKSQIIRAIDDNGTAIWDIDNNSDNNLLFWDTEGYLQRPGWEYGYNVSSSNSWDGWASESSVEVAAIPMNSKCFALSNQGDNLTFIGYITDVDLTTSGFVSAFFVRSGVVYGANTVPNVAIPNTQSFFYHTTGELIGSKTNRINTFTEHYYIAPSSATLTYTVEGTTYNVTDNGLGGFVEVTTLTSGSIDYESGNINLTFIKPTDGSVSIAYSLDILDTSVATNNVVDGTKIQIKLKTPLTTGSVFANYVSNILIEDTRAPTRTGWHVFNSESSTASIRTAKSNTEAYVTNIKTIEVTHGKQIHVAALAKKFTGSPCLIAYFIDANGLRVPILDYYINSGNISIVSGDTIKMTLSTTIDKFSINVLTPVSSVFLVMGVDSDTSGPYGTHQVFFTDLQMNLSNNNQQYQSPAILSSLPRPEGMGRFGKIGQVIMNAGSGKTVWGDYSAGGSGGGIASINGLSLPNQTITGSTTNSNIDGINVASGGASHVIQAAKVDQVTDPNYYGMLKKSDYATMKAGGGSLYAEYVSSTISPGNDSSSVWIFGTIGTRLVYLPSTPFNSMTVTIKDAAYNASTNNIIINGNGNDVEYGNLDVLNQDGVIATYIFSQVENKWFILKKDVSQLTGLYNLVPINSNQTLALNTIYMIDTSSNRNLVLPAGSQGAYVTIIDANRMNGLVTVTPSGTDTIEGSATFLEQNEDGWSTTFVYNSINSYWNVH